MPMRQSSIPSAEGMDNIFPLTALHWYINESNGDEWYSWPSSDIT